MNDIISPMNNLQRNNVVQFHLSANTGIWVNESGWIYVCIGFAPQNDF
jgi:hypothetical protein